MANLQQPDAMNFFNTNVIDEILILGITGQLSYRSTSEIINLQISTSYDAMKMQRKCLLSDRRWYA
jgi:hypothetical protein